MVLTSRVKACACMWHISSDIAKEKLSRLSAFSQKS
jgi:hypothetical protein